MRKADIDLTRGRPRRRRKRIPHLSIIIINRSIRAGVVIIINLKDHVSQHIAPGVRGGVLGLRARGLGGGEVEGEAGGGGLRVLGDHVL